MRTRIETYHRLEHGRKVTIPAGLPVVRADNLPADSKIKYWLADCPPKADDEIESHFRNVGFGFLANEVDAPGLRSHYENLPVVIENHRWCDSCGEYLTPIMAGTCRICGTTHRP